MDAAGPSSYSKPQSHSGSLLARCIRWMASEFLRTRATKASRLVTMAKLQPRHERHQGLRLARNFWRAGQYWFGAISEDSSWQ